MYLYEGVPSLALHRTWRFASFCVHLLGILMHWERPFSSRAVKVIVDGVVHENLAIRKVSGHCASACVCLHAVHTYVSY